MKILENLTTFIETILIGKEPFVHTAKIQSW